MTEFFHFPHTEEFYLHSKGYVYSNVAYPSLFPAKIKLFLKSVLEPAAIFFSIVIPIIVNNNNKILVCIVLA